MPAKKVRTKEQVRKDVTRKLLELADAVTGPTRPIKERRDFAASIGLDAGNFSHALAGTRAIPIEYAVIACDKFEVNREWMFGNAVEMFGHKDIEKRVVKLEGIVAEIEQEIKGKRKLNRV